MIGSYIKECTVESSMFDILTLEATALCLTWYFLLGVLETGLNGVRANAWEGD